MREYDLNFPLHLLRYKVIGFNKLFEFIEKDTTTVRELCIILEMIKTELGEPVKIPYNGFNISSHILQQSKLTEQEVNEVLNKLFPI